MWILIARYRESSSIEAIWRLSLRGNIFRFLAQNPFLIHYSSSSAAEEEYQWAVKGGEVLQWVLLEWSKPTTQVWSTDRPKSCGHSPSYRLMLEEAHRSSVCFVRCPSGLRRLYLSTYCQDAEFQSALVAESVSSSSDLSLLDFTVSWSGRHARFIANYGTGKCFMFVIFDFRGEMCRGHACKCNLTYPENINSHLSLSFLSFGDLKFIFILSRNRNFL